MNNLIFIEGVSGTGKSTIVTNLCKKLHDNSYTTVTHLEGEITSPVDSFWFAYLTISDYENVQLIYPDFTRELSENSVIFDDYVLVRYQDFKRQYYSPELYAYLKEREYCYNALNPLLLDRYPQIFTDMWRRFAESAQTLKDIVILDGSFLHHQINDLIHNYNAAEDEIVRNLTELLRSVQPLSPIVFYLSSSDVGKSLKKAWSSRGNAAPTAEIIAFWQHLKDMDLRVLCKLPVESHIIDVTNNSWDTALDIILQCVTGNTPIIHHYDSLIAENNDPVHDPKSLQEYMDKWDGEQFIESLQLTPEKSVLEIGVGTGRLAVRVCDKCGNFTGIDISPKSIKRASSNLQAYANVELLCGDYMTCIFCKSFDVIYSSLTFMHLKDKRSAIHKTAELLTPGGRFVLSVSKDQSTELDFGNRTLVIFPDNSGDICEYIEYAGLILEKQFETEFAFVFAARKG